ncbi:MAG TPA: septal ring lytic transglycosylase RlpA family protein [Ignavibacteriales bacterium]|nr:septal ring lytic transglycosylase RlpA family protein [Ignavibacteriales bacterium]HOL81044.1 septal ring lytic transglycosylase RlpA family protein [Ignavibacteriales bacterium]HPP32824.1 septal ring lytic transglycosylase RlpA family protein [Ignavibacteriales bacterium]
MKKKLYLLLLTIVLSSCQVGIVRYSSGESDSFVNIESDEVKENYTSSDVLYTEYGLITYYAEDFHGKQTANGEIFDMYKLSAAHIKFPLNTIIRVTNLKNNKSVVIKVNDRMPINNKGRILDVSKATAQKLDFIKDGVVEARIDVLKWGDGKRVQSKETVEPVIRFK